MNDLSIGMMGLGVMGRNLALNIEDHGFSVAAWDAWEAPVSSAPGARVPSADPSPKARRSAADR